MSPHHIKDIYQVLPHRYPFLMIDRVVDIVTDIEQGAHIEAYKNVSINENFFNGHFPNQPVMPGVLTLECLAQAAGYLGMMMKGEDRDRQVIFYFAGSDKVRFKRPVEPGDKLILKAKFISQRRGIWRFDCQALVDGEIACTADIICAEKRLEA